MILLLDIGNTRLKWMRWEEGRLLPGGAVTHREADVARQLDAAFAGMPVPRRLVAASVAPAEVRIALDAWTQHRWQTSVEFVTPAAAHAGVINAYPRPERLGADRWAALLAARAAYPGAACIVSCGSALTLDAIDSAGRHLGGLIVPGLGTMHRSLTGGDIHLDAAAGLDQPPETLLAQDTVQAVGFGIQYCLAAYIDRHCGLVERQLGGACRRLLTGGDAERLRPLLTGEYQVAPHLVLEGLAVLVGA